MSIEEATAFEKKYGYKVSGFRVAVDALAIYVNKDNPIPCLIEPQLSGIFSSNRKAPGSTNAKTWGDLGMTGEWATRPIALYGRNSLSGTYEYFRETAIYGGDYKPEVQQQPGSEAVVQNVAHDKFAIGYSGIGYKTDGVRTVPLAAYYGGKCYDAVEDVTLTNKYPISRYLYVYVNKPPNQPLDPLRAEFIKYILSKDGQTLTEKGGFFPITNEIRESELAKLRNFDCALNLHQSQQGDADRHLRGTAGFLVRDAHHAFARAVAVVDAVAGRVERLPGDAGRIVDP